VEGAQFLGAHRHPEISMHTHPLADYMQCIYRGDWPGAAELMLASANKLARSRCSRVGERRDLTAAQPDR
jgi:aspartate racemase